jgi:dihydroflavonol-4-reductase
MKLAITGASGLLGANVAAAALAAGHEVVCTRRGTSRADAVADLAITWVDAPLSDGSALAGAFAGCDAVVHCAASTSILPRVTPELEEANVVGTRNVVDAVISAGVRRLVHVSSTVAVGVSEDGVPCTESSPWNLAAHGLADGYATTKRQSEEEVLAAVAAGRLDAVVANPGFLFGPRDARPSSGRMILEVASGKALLAAPGRNNFVDVRAVAASLLAAVERGRTGERYILGGENLTYLEMFHRIAAVVGGRPPWGSAPRWVAALAGLGGDALQWASGREGAVTSNTVRWGYHPGFVVSSDKARQELGHAPGPVDDAVRAAWDWFAAVRSRPPGAAG